MWRRDDSGSGLRIVTLGCILARGYFSPTAGNESHGSVFCLLHYPAPVTCTKGVDRSSSAVGPVMMSALPSLLRWSTCAGASSR